MNHKQFRTIIQGILDKFPDLFDVKPVNAMARAFFLMGTNQSRIFLVHPNDPLAMNMPEEGRFVALTVPEYGNEKDKLVIAYCEYPKGTTKSRTEAMLAYKEEEYDKAPAQVAKWIEHGIAPEADGE